ncbi:MAG: ABC transporter permease [Alphaproteobacteria bacterium]|nr:ABC transporter permease [Alphaproteobacteria bacterium]
MTRIDLVEVPPPPPAARLGLLVPGLGHLLTGDRIVGVGLLGVDAWLLWAAIAGFPRLGEVTGLAGTRLSWHGLVALGTWAVLAAGAWGLAWRCAFPRPYDAERANSAWGIFRRELRRNRNGMLGLVGVVQLFALTLLAPLISPFDPDMVDAGTKLLGPDATYLFGTDEFGRDVFSRVVMGARISVAIGFIAVSIAATLGTTLGALAGWFGGWLDRVLMWVVDLLLSVPRLVLLLAIVGLFRPPGAIAIFVIVVVLGLTGWMGVSRIVRSQVLSLKEQDFIQAARALGMGHARIIFVHLIPNAFAPVIVYGSLAVGTTMLAEASLSFLGLGVQPPTSTWGTLVADGRHKLQIAPWIALFPGLAIVYAVMCFNLLGDGLRDALDPKQRGA